MDLLVDFAVCLLQNLQKRLREESSLILGDLEKCVDKFISIKVQRFKNEKR